MITKKIILFMMLLIAGCAFSACTAGQSATPTLALAPTATPAPTLAPTETAAPTLLSTDPAIAAITLDCTDWGHVNNGIFRAENNTWGKGDLTGWSQCIGLGTAASGALVARWNWDWLDSGGGVRAYPEVIVGQKPGSQSTTPDLPMQVNQVAAAEITYDVASTHTGTGNLAFDIWLTDTPNPDTWGVPPITHELMIWLEAYGSIAPGGSWIGKEKIGGIDYSVYVGENWADGWTYIAFYRTPAQLGAGTLDLADFLAYLVENGLATGDEYLASIEFGNEVVSGQGETILNQYAVSVQHK
jgi:hypothetical protein